MNPRTLLLAALLCFAGYSQAANPPKELPKAAPVTESYFRKGEFNLDLYGTGSLKNEQRDEKDIRFGVGVGGTYFFTKNFGLGLRAESDSAAHSLVDLALGRVTLRAPLSPSFAPYGFVQGGFLFERDRWQAGAGGGLEFRATKYIGVFGEAGLNVDTDGNGKMNGAVGVRLSF